MIIVNREELIKEFDKQQLEILLNDLQDIDKFTGFKDGAFKYELGKYQANLLVNCIKKQKEVIEKAIDYVENGDLLYLANKCSIIYRGNVEVVAVCDRLNELLKILKEVE